MSYLDLSDTEYCKARRGQTCLILFDGKVVFERYDAGGAPDKLQMLARGSKSFDGVAAPASSSPAPHVACSGKTRSRPPVAARPSRRRLPVPRPTDVNAPQTLAIA
jgi:hypothetical protein